MVMWWVMFCEVIPPCFDFLVSNKQISLFLFHPVLRAIKMHVHCLGTFCLTVAVTIPSDAELSVLIGVGVWGGPISWSVVWSGTDV